MTKFHNSIPDLVPQNFLGRSKLRFCLSHRLGWELSVLETRQFSPLVQRQGTWFVARTICVHSCATRKVCTRIRCDLLRLTSCFSQGHYTKLGLIEIYIKVWNQNRSSIHPGKSMWHWPCLSIQLVSSRPDEVRGRLLRRSWGTFRWSGFVVSCTDARERSLSLNWCPPID
jgi:hypothetical protein